MCFENEKVSMVGNKTYNVLKRLPTELFNVKKPCCWCVFISLIHGYISYQHTRNMPFLTLILYSKQTEKEKPISICRSYKYVHTIQYFFLMPIEKLAKMQQQNIIIYKLIFCLFCLFVCSNKKWTKLLCTWISCFAPIFGVNRDWATDWLKVKRRFSSIFKTLMNFFISFQMS